MDSVHGEEKMKKLTSILVDDEALAREALRNHLSEFENIEIVDECENGFEAVKSIRKNKPDIVFLDIQMPKLDGFDVVELLEGEKPAIVFVTAYDEYAMKAFEVEAIDYILKPASRERLAQALARITKQISDGQAEKIEKVVRRRSDEAAPLARVLVRDGSEVNIIPVDKILYVEAQDDYIEIHTTDLGTHLKHERLSRMEKLLDNSLFCRVHRSYILNISAISKIEPHGKESKRAILKNGRNIPVSKSGYERLMKFL